MDCEEAESAGRLLTSALLEAQPVDAKSAASAIDDLAASKSLSRLHFTARPAGRRQFRFALQHKTSLTIAK
jgi:hypothetical protein